MNTGKLKPSATRDVPLESLQDSPSDTQGNPEAGQSPGRVMNGVLWCTPFNQPFQPLQCLHFLTFHAEVAGFSLPLLVKEARL